uniref:Small nuclear ribonucleoprotein G n=1 Tax=Oreochromis niloticus TaxID=8128 RepID=A0A669DVC1_ORENI
MVFFSRFMDKKLSLKLNGGRHVQGILRGFDPFMNLVVDDCLEMGPGGQQNTIGMVVSKFVFLNFWYCHQRKFVRLI